MTHTAGGRDALVGLTLMLVVAGCASDSAPQPPPVTTADCTQRIRVHGVVYSGYGHTDHEATELGTADQAECHDMGPSPEGSVFEDDPSQVDIWAFDRYPTEEVVGVEVARGTFAVFVAEGVPSARSGEILQQLTAER